MNPEQSKEHPEKVRALAAELGTRIGQIVAKLGEERAARVADKSVKQLRRYIAGAEAPFMVLARLARASGTSLDWLAYGEDRTPATGGVREREEFVAYSSVSLSGHERMEELHQEFILVPRYAVQAAAGPGIVVYDEQIVDYLAFKRDWVERRLGLNPRDLLVLEAVGDSMEPTISNGDIIAVVRERRIRDNAIYVLVYGNELVCKRVERRRDGLVIKSDNPRYEPEVIPADEESDLRIVGRVFWSGGLL